MKIIITLVICILSMTTRAKHLKMDLQTALDKKLVKATAQSLGSYQGYCMNIHLISLSPDSLVIHIEPGRRLNSINDKLQDILITKQEEVFLARREDKWIKVKGYCCQAGNSAPLQNAAYTINRLANDSLVRIARFLNSAAFDSHLEQQAIWAISDKHNTASIANKNDSNSAPLRKLVAAIKGEPVPWYSILSLTHAYPSGTIVNYPQVLKGKLEYSQEKEGYVTLFITDEKGLPVCIVRSQWLPACANKEYPLDVNIKGIRKGKYSIGLASEGKTLVKKNFEI